jgi:hypothetical protein
VTRGGTHELKVSIRLTDKQKNGRTIHNVLTSEAALVAIAGVTGKADGRGHLAWLAYSADLSAMVARGPARANGRNRSKADIS